MNFAILRVAKLKTIGSIAGSGRHTFREIETPNADPSRLKLNGTFGPIATPDLLRAVRERLPQKRRKDAVLALEYLITASPEWFGDWQAKPKGYRPEFFHDAFEWLQNKHGIDNVVACQVHLDEKTPHMCVYVVPLTADGRLSAKDFVGGRAKLSKMQTDFYKEVGARYGLIRGIEGSKATHAKQRRFYAHLDANTAMAIPEPPPELSLINIASGRAAKYLNEYRSKLVERAAEVEKAAEFVRLSNAGRQGQAKALKRLREELAELKKHKERAQTLQRELDAVTSQLGTAENQVAILKAELSDAEQTISRQSHDIEKMRQRRSNEKDATSLNL